MPKIARSVTPGDRGPSHGRIGYFRHWSRQLRALLMATRICCDGDHTTIHTYSWMSSSISVTNAAI